MVQIYVVVATDETSQCINDQRKGEKAGTGDREANVRLDPGTV